MDLQVPTTSNPFPLLHADLRLEIWRLASTTPPLPSSKSKSSHLSPPHHRAVCILPEDDELPRLVFATGNPGMLSTSREARDVALFSADHNDANGNAPTAPTASPHASAPSTFEARGVRLGWGTSKLGSHCEIVANVVQNSPSGPLDESGRVGMANKTVSQTPCTRRVLGRDPCAGRTMEG